MTQTTLVHAGQTPLTQAYQGETLLVPASENILYIFGNATFLTATM